MRWFARYSYVTGAVTVFFRTNVMYNACVKSREISLIELISKTLVFSSAIVSLLTCGLFRCCVNSKYYQGNWSKVSIF